MATLTKSSAKTFTHDNYAATTSPSTKTLPVETNEIFIQNMDSTNNLLISFDGGTTFKTVLPGTALSIDCNKLLSYNVKSSAGTVNAECLYGSEA